MLTIFKFSAGGVCKKRKLCERQSSSRSTEEADLCGDYGRTVAHQLRSMPTYDRDLCRLQVRIVVVFALLAVYCLFICCLFAF